MLPLYRLLEIPKSGRVYICEGEKAADAAWDIGLPATTSAHGSAAAEKTDWRPLAGMEVVILPDADEPGGRYAHDVAVILAKSDPPGRVRTLELPGLPEGGDVVEYIDAHPDDGVEYIAGSIAALADARPIMLASNLIGGPVLVNMADVEPCEIQWLWPGRIALGRITLLVGKPGEGKSYLACDWTARITTGTPWPDGAECPLGSVLLVCAEDDPADTIRPRLDAHGADVRRVSLLSAVRHIRKGGKPNDVMFTLEDVCALEDALKAIPDCRLIVIDPIGSFLGGGTDAHRDNEVRAVLAPIGRLAEQYGAAVVMIAHRRKSAGTNADEMALGSRAFTGIARAVWHVSRDGENPNRRLFLPGKNNLAKEGHGLAFSLTGEPVAAVKWEREPVMMSADEALAMEQDRTRDNKPGPAPEARNEAAEWLRGVLSKGAVLTKQVVAEAKAAGLSMRTVRRAADEVGVKRERCEFSTAWQWRLLKLAKKTAELVQPGPTPVNLDNLDNITKTAEIPPIFESSEATCPSHFDLDNTAGGSGVGI